LKRDFQTEALCKLWTSTYQNARTIQLLCNGTCTETSFCLLA